MLTEDEAKIIGLKNRPAGSQLIRVVDYGSSYILQINGPDPDEGNLDPFFSVDKRTGAFRDFDISQGGMALIRKFT